MTPPKPHDRPDDTPVPAEKKRSDTADADLVSMLAKNPLAALAVLILSGGGGFGMFSLKQNTEETVAMRKSIEDLRTELRVEIGAVKSKIEVISVRQDDNRQNIKDIQNDIKTISREIRNSGLSLGTGAGKGFFQAPGKIDLSMQPGEGRAGFPTP